MASALGSARDGGAFSQLSQELKVKFILGCNILGHSVLLCFFGWIVYIFPRDLRRSADGCASLTQDVIESFKGQAFAAGDRVAHGVKVLHMDSLPHF